MAISANNAQMEAARNAICGAVEIDENGNDISGAYAGLAQQLYQKGSELITQLGTDLSGFSGATQEVVMDKIGKIGDETNQSTLAYVATKLLPEMAKMVAIAIEMNRVTIEKYDQSLAKNIQDGGK